MKLKLSTCVASVILAALPQAMGSTNILAAWNFDYLQRGANSSPSPTTGLGSARVVDLTGPQITAATAGSSSNGTNCWQIAGGYSTSAPLGAQGAQFSASTLGFYRIRVSFDVYATPDAEANLQVQYTTEGTIWHNATITSAGADTISENDSTNVSVVIGSYVSLESGWNNQITVDLSGVSGVDNNANFAIRLVNAASGTNCVTTTGSIYNNSSGNWSFDNVAIQGVSIDTIAQWTFIVSSNTPPVNNPVPDIDASGNTATAQIIGFNLPNVTFADGSAGSTNWGDITTQAGSSSSPGNQNCWRLRGQNPGNGWYTGEPIGSQGAEFDVSTVNYSNVMVSFDVYFTSQAEAKMCVLYTTDGWETTNTADSLFYAANPTFVVTNSLGSPTYSPYTVSGTYFYETVGQNWYNNWVVDFTGVPGVDNNPNFGIRFVNAATGGDCVAYNGGSYNNSSGNSRLANVNFGGQFGGLNPPTLAPASNVSVDNPWTITFSPDVPNWRGNITAIYVNSVLVTNAAYATNVAGQLTFTPSKATNVLGVSGLDTIVIYATGYGEAKVTQPVAPGAFKKFALAVAPLGPSASSGTLEVNPVFTLSDQYGNTTINPYSNMVVTAVVGTNGATGPGQWTLGGATIQPETNGVITFTNLSATATGAAAVTGAVINVTIAGYTNTANHTTTTNFNLAAFSIIAPPVPFTPGNVAVLQIDTLSNNTTFSIIELRSSATNPSPVNIVPVSATAGTNSLRMAPSATTGRLCQSDDGTLLCFAAFVDGSSATPDETLNLNRAAAGMNYTNGVTIGATYTSVSYGGSQARAACSFDGTNWTIDDKGGIYEGSLATESGLTAPNVDALNNIVVKTFGQNAGNTYPSAAANGHLVYVATQKTANGSPIPVVYQLAYDANDDLYDVEQGNNLTTDPIASDFYLISTNAGETYDIMYINQQVSSSSGIIQKLSWVPNGNQVEGGYGWVTNGIFTNGVGVDGLLVCTNGSGGAYLYYTTGGGGSGGNSLVRINDTNGWNAPFGVSTVNTLYTVAKTASLKGIAFVPTQLAYTNQLIPTPLLTPQSNGSVAAPFIITNTPDDSGWRAALNLVTVNGTVLPTAAYSKTQAGQITFNPAQSVLLQTSGSKTIGFSAPGYVSNSVVLSLASGPAAQLIITTQPTAPAHSGASLAHQPVVKAQDLYGNAVTNGATITASASQNSWILGGSTNQATSAGVATYSGLTAFSANGITGATIGFTLGGVSTTSAAFNIPAAVASTLTQPTVTSAAGVNKFVFGFTNYTGLSFSVLGTNNVSAPTSTWPLLGHATESPAGSGNYTFTNAVGTNTVEFYILRQP